MAPLLELANIILHEYDYIRPRTGSSSPLALNLPFLTTMIMAFSKANELMELLNSMLYRRKEEVVEAILKLPE
ncbi:MAG: hypothetical protein NDP09_06720 [Crenarchaeota archaeon]|nr:hypothetical protein [Thermoproteota archaeon]